jgi:hypothetical protein
MIGGGEKVKLSGVRGGSAEAATLRQGRVASIVVDYDEQRLAGFQLQDGSIEVAVDGEWIGGEPEGNRWAATDGGSCWKRRRGVRRGREFGGALVEGVEPQQAPAIHERAGKPIVEAERPHLFDHPFRETGVRDEDELVHLLVAGEDDVATYPVEVDAPAAGVLDLHPDTEYEVQVPAILHITRLENVDALAVTPSIVLKRRGCYGNASGGIAAAQHVHGEALELLPSPRAESVRITRLVG